jgi:hypothetical protein
MSASEVKQRLHRMLRLQTHHFSSEVPRLLFIFYEVTLRFGVDALWRFVLGLDVHDEPISIQPTGKARSLPEQHDAMRRGMRGKTNHHALAGCSPARSVLFIGLG